MYDAVLLHLKSDQHTGAKIGPDSDLNYETNLTKIRLILKNIWPIQKIVWNPKNYCIEVVKSHKINIFWLRFDEEKSI